MKFYKFFCVILAFILLFSFTSCKQNFDTYSTNENNEVGENAKTRSYITLLYSSSDGFNPYTVKTDINRHLCKLIFESLVKLDNEFNPILNIAENISFDDKKCIVTIKDKLFSDGSVLTAKDIVYSFNLAKSSQSIYSSKLYITDSCSLLNDKTVVFNLNKNDKYFANLLDFPIIKAESDKVSDSDSVLQPPIGSGKFKVSKEQDFLELNTVSFNENSNIKTVKLINSPDDESISHYSQIGATDIFYTDISDGSITRIGGKKIEINLTNLVYLGINQNYGQLNQNLLRQALSSGIDREKICQNVFFNNAISATGFFSPVWKETKSVQNIQITSNYEITVENLEKIGYNELDNKGKRVNKSNKSINLTLLVNSENRTRVLLAGIIASQLEEFGINISVIEKPYDQYLESLQNGDFQLYLGEVKLTENMDFSQMLSENGVLQFGLPKIIEENNDETDITQDNLINQQSLIEKVNPYDVINGFYNGQNSITDVATVLQSEMPFVPICYRTGALFYNDNIENLSNSSESDIYFSVESYICYK